MPTQLDFRFKGQPFRLQAEREVSDEEISEAFRRVQDPNIGDPGPGFQVFPRGPRQLRPARAVPPEPQTPTEVMTEFLRGVVPQTREEALRVGAELAGATGGAAVAQRLIPSPLGRAGVTALGRIQRGAKFVARSTAAALGAGGGALTTGADLDEAKFVAAMFGVGEGASLLLVKAVTNPFSRVVTPEGARALRAGIRPTPGQATRSGTLDLLESAGEKALGTSILLTDARERASNAASRLLAEFRGRFEPANFNTVRQQLYNTIPNFPVGRDATQSLKTVGEAAVQEMRFLTGQDASRRLANKVANLGESSTYSELQLLRSSISDTSQGATGIAQRELLRLRDRVDDVIQQSSPTPEIAQQWRHAKAFVRQKGIGDNIEEIVTRATRTAATGEQVISGRQILDRLLKMDTKERIAMFGDVETFNRFKEFAQILNTTQVKPGKMGGTLALTIAIGQPSAALAVATGTVTPAALLLAAIPQFSSWALSNPLTAKILTEGIGTKATRESVIALNRLAAEYVVRTQRIQVRENEPIIPTLESGAPGRLPQVKVR